MKALNLLKAISDAAKIQDAESYNDYPPAAVKAAKQALEWREEYKDEVTAGTRVGWERANQLANKEKLSVDTIKRMVSFFARHEGNETVSPEHRDEPWKDNGHVSWLLWGGDAGKKWAEQKLKEIEKQNNS